MPKANPNAPHRLLDLAALDALLRRHDMPRGPDDWQRVHDLLALRFQQGRMPRPPEDLARLLGPLLCRGPEEQARFPHLVGQWLTGDDTLHTSAQINVFDSKPWQRWQNRLRRFDRRQRIASLANVLLLAGLWAAVSLFPSQVVVTDRLPQIPNIEPQPPIVLPEKPPVEAATPSPSQPFPGTVPKPSTPIPGKTSTEINLGVVNPNPPQEPVHLPPDWERWRDKTGLAVGFLPWLLALPWLYRRYVSRSKILETDTPDGDEVVKNLDFANPVQPLYGGSRSEQALSKLGRVSYGESRRLYIAKTVEATARQAGYFVPCCRQSLARPVYLILVRSQHIHDHQALLAEELVRRFREAGLSTKSYRFLDSPSQLIPWPPEPDSGRRVALGELALRHECARLIIISEGRILFHPATGQPRPWLKEFKPWPQRVWLGIGEVDALDARLLFLNDFLYLPLASISLTDVATYLSASEGWQLPNLQTVEDQNRLPDSIADYPQRWLKPHPPKEIPLSTLTQELRAYLHEDGWALLQTLVAFPECQWKLTQAVDYQYFKGQPTGQAEARELRLTRLMKLPWFTHAYFPRYLRVHLLRQTSHAERLRIRSTWENLFQQRSGQNGVRVLVPLGKLVEDLIRANRAGALGDPIFVQVLRGQRPDFSQFSLPHVLEVVFPHGRNRWDLRPALWAITLAGLASWGGGLLWDRRGEDWLLSQWQSSPSQQAQPEPFQDRLQDGSPGPFMVVIPAGSFTMGSPDSEKGHSPDEVPQRTVSIARPFALGRDEVSFDDYDRYAKANDKPLPADQGWGRGKQPVINVSWQDAQDYAAWLTQQTGHHYRLPSEAEWEYAARADPADTKTAYWWGDDIRQNNWDWANCEGCGSLWDNKKTAPVGSFNANRWGLHDTAGNVWEWVADCWHGSYQGAPKDGSAWAESAACDRRVVRGGSWFLPPKTLRSANRYKNKPSYSSKYLGFRLARDL